MKIFITGGTGFIGSNFVTEALKCGYDLRVLVGSNNQRKIIDSNSPETLQKKLHEVNSSDFVDVDVFVHFAAFGVNQNQSSWEDCFKINVLDSVNCWIKANEAGVKKFLICGSCFEYGKAGEVYAEIPSDAALQPNGPYHASKAAATMAAIGLARERGLTLSILRPFHVFGDGEPEYRFWPSLRKAALSGADFEMTQGEQIRDFVPVKLVVGEFLKRIGDQGIIAGQPEIRNIGTGEPTKLCDFAQYWWKYWNAKGNLKIGLIPYRKNEVMRYVPKLKTN